MKLFLSYPRDDVEVAKRIYARLQEAGFDVWAFFTLPEEQRRTREIRREHRQQGIEQSDIIVVITSNNFKASVGVAQEIIYAQYRGKDLLPIVIEPTEIPFPLLGTPYIDISGDWDEGMNQVIERLRAIHAEKLTHNDAAPLSNEQLVQQRKRVFSADTLDRIFFAYSHHQRPIAKVLCEILIKNGKAVFWDAKIKAGATWRQTIQRALDDASHIVVLWTPDAARSDEVEREVSYA
ncbi:MAG: toll/interleukin-1 receptor domain-containing protein, partial [Anaerolineae bacterium]|nr:toll/interleukin-1 receptor domain-containing protein [Anaerolineae bacterium]